MNKKKYINFRDHKNSAVEIAADNSYRTRFNRFLLSYAHLKTRFF